LKASSRCVDLRSRRFTLLSFKRPSPPERRKKASDSRQRPPEVSGTYVVSECVRRRSSCRVAGTFLRRSASSRRMVAAARGVSSGPEAHETALPGLYESPVESLQRQGELAHRPPLDPHSAPGGPARAPARRP